MRGKAQHFARSPVLPGTAKTAATPEAREEADAEAVARVLAGETAAFRILVARYQTLVLRLVRNFAPRSAAHEDLTQDTFIRPAPFPARTAASRRIKIKDGDESTFIAP